METHPHTGQTYAKLLISVRHGDYVSLTNIDTSTAITEGFSRLIEAKSSGFGFFNRHEVKLILARINEKSTRVQSSGHYYGMTEAGFVIDPPDQPRVPNAFEVMLERDLRLIAVDLSFNNLEGRTAALDVLATVSCATTPISETAIELFCFVTQAPMYSKTLVVRGRGRDGRSHLLMAKQTRSHFSNTDIDIISGSGSNFSHYTKFEKKTGYETVSVYTDPR